jgi:hypothetical protein
MIYSNRIPIIRFGDYETIIPFDTELLVVEHTLTSDDVLSPLYKGAPESTGRDPRPGATVIYKLTADGSHEPSFDPLFVRMNGYQYIMEAGAVNTIVFTFDGTNFLYTVLRETPVATPPVLGKEELVGDFGWEPGALVVNANGASSYLAVLLPPGRYILSAFDLVASVHYTGADELTYHMQRAGDPSVSGTDPKAVAVEFDCGDTLAPVDISMWITAGMVMSAPLVFSVSVSDPNGVCLPA